MIKIEHLRQFLAVSNHATLKQAAKELHRTPAAVSMTLKLIESELGGTLFEGERKQTLTPLGRYVRDRAVRVIDEYQATIDDINRFARGESGGVRIAAVPSMTTQLLPAAIAQLASGFPGLQIDLRDIDSQAVAMAVRKGDVDIGIASLSSASKGLDVKLLAEDPFMCVCPMSHPLAKHSAPLSWAQIEKYSFIANGLCDQMNISEVQNLNAGARLYLRNVVSLTAFVRAEYGVTLLPYLALSLVSDLACLKLADQRAKRRIYLLRRADRSLPPAARELVRIIQSFARLKFE